MLQDDDWIVNTDIERLGQLMTDDTVQLVRRFQDGDSEAAELLFAKYFERLDAFAGRKMSDPLKRRIGSDDIAQSVYRSFFAKAQDGVFRVEESGQLWGLLATLAHRKIMHNVEWHSKAKKRSYSREQAPLDSDNAPELAGDADSPMQQAIIDDAVESILNAISPHWKKILSLSESAMTVAQIATEVRDSETEVRRVLILRMKCAAGLENEELSELLDCSVVTVRRIWRNLISLAEEMAAADS